MNSKNPILIVGGAIGGMASALALARQGIPSIVLKQKDHFRESGSGVQFSPNAFKILDFWGVAPSFREIAFFPEELSYLDGLTGNALMQLPLGSKIEKRFGHPLGSFLREQILNTFVDECKNSPLINLVNSGPIIEVREEEDVIALSKSGTAYRGAALIGCDGIWSVVRKKTIIADPPRNSKQVIYRGVVKKSDMPSGLNLDNIVYYVRPGAHLVYYPIGRDGLYEISAIFQSNRTPGYHEREGNKEELYSYFAGSHTKVMEVLDRIHTAHMWTLCDHNPTKMWSRGRLTLLGDAAHGALPYSASGAGMAIEDAVVIAEKIQEHGRDYTAAFEAYQKERYLRCAYVQSFSRLYGDAHHASGAARELRNQILSQRTIEENYNWLSYLYSGIEINELNRVMD